MANTRTKRSSGFRNLRILLLLMLLLVIALQQFNSHRRVSSWDTPLWAVVYPINADRSQISSDHIKSLTVEDFSVIEQFFIDEAAEYGLALEKPVSIKLAPPVETLPPAPPSSGNLAEIVWWSLKARWWAYNADTFSGPTADIQLFVLYHDPDQHPQLDHSVGIRNGGYAFINAFASDSQGGSNAVIISHELLHTLGASDKYDPTNGRPQFPHGYADPQRQPLHPQSFAEIMGGRIPLSAAEATIPDSTDEVLIGTATAREIRWLE